MGTKTTKDTTRLKEVAEMLEGELELLGEARVLLFTFLLIVPVVDR